MPASVSKEPVFIINVTNGSALCDAGGKLCGLPWSTRGAELLRPRGFRFAVEPWVAAGVESSRLLLRSSGASLSRGSRGGAELLRPRELSVSGGNGRLDPEFTLFFRDFEIDFGWVAITFSQYLFHIARIVGTQSARASPLRAKKSKNARFAFRIEKVHGGTFSTNYSGRFLPARSPRCRSPVCLESLSIYRKGDRPVAPTRVHFYGCAGSTGTCVRLSLPRKRESVCPCHRS